MSKMQVSFVSEAPDSQVCARVVGFLHEIREVSIQGEGDGTIRTNIKQLWARLSHNSCKYFALVLQPSLQLVDICTCGTIPFLMYKNFPGEIKLQSGILSMKTVPFDNFLGKKIFFFLSRISAKLLFFLIPKKLS
jgi:hypothetical protein